MNEWLVRTSLPGLEAYDPAAQTAIEHALLRLLARRAALYTMDESSSIPVETAQELLQSILFLLRLYLSSTGQNARSLLDGDPDALLDAAVQHAQRQVAQVAQLHAAVSLHLPEPRNEYLTDTLRQLPLFFKRYDARYFAHQIPCALDYPLCVPVAETLLGVEYVLEYLRRLLAECLLLRQFDGETALRALASAYPDPTGLPLNLCAPILRNAVGLALLGLPIAGLRMTPAQRDQLSAQFSNFDQNAAAQALCAASDRVLTALAPTTDAKAFLVRQTALSLTASIREGCAFAMW